MLSRAPGPASGDGPHQHRRLGRRPAKPARWACGVRAVEQVRAQQWMRRGAVAAVLALVASGATAFSHTPALAWGLVRYPRRVHAARCGMQCPVYDAPGAQVRVDGRADGAVR